MDYQQLIPQRLDIFTFVIFLGIVQGFFFSVSLLNKQAGMDRRQRILGLLLLIVSLILLEIFLCYSGLIVHVLWLVDFSEPLNFLYGPVGWILVYSYIHKQLPGKLSRHLIPFFIYLAYALFFFIQPESYKFNAYIDAYYPQLEQPDAKEIFSADPLGIKRYINPISIVHVLIYWVLIFQLILSGYRRQMPDFWTTKVPDIKWLRYFLMLFLLSYLHWIFRTVTGIQDLQDHISAAFQTVIIYFIGFKLLNDRIAGRKSPDRKYSRSSLTTERSERILAQLEILMEKEQYFLRPDCSLASLSKKTGHSHHHVSQALNEQLGKSFAGYLNTYRIGYAEQLLLEQQHLKIEEIAERSGFNSKSSFNTAFRKITGKTPSQYRKEHG